MTAKEIREEVTNMLKYSKTLIVAIALALSFVPMVSAQETRARPRQVSTPPAEATVAINEQFANSFLDAIFENLKEPSVSLNRGSVEYGCASVATLKREVGGIRTNVRFQNGRIAAPLAFAGSYYSSLLGCIQFSGWANTTINLEYDRSRQALVGRVKIEEITLPNIPSLASGALLGVVQAAIDNRYNPFNVLTLEQISSRVAIAPAGGALRLRAKEIRPEITPGSVKLYVIYEFVKAV